VVWLVIFHPTFGPVNQTLTALGIGDPPKWFADVRWALSAIIAQTVWLHLGYYIVVYMAGLSTIPPSLYESAQIDGANFIQRFLHVTVPGVSPTTFFLLIIGVINSFKVFDQIMVTTRGGPGTATMVFAVYIYNLAFLTYRMGYASAIAWMMFVVIVIITAFQMRQQRRYTTYLA
jgi:multiple sugar transport system permease protein